MWGREAEQSNFSLFPNMHCNTLHIQANRFSFCIHASAPCHCRGSYGFLYSVSSLRYKAEAIANHAAANDSIVILEYSELAKTLKLIGLMLF